MLRLTFCLALLLPILGFSQINWWFDTDDAAFGQAAAADLDGDSLYEIVFSTYRNDGMVYALNAEDGSLLWQYDTGGCNDVAPLIYDVDQDGELEVIVPSSCNPTTFCINGLTGLLEWSIPSHGSDSPPTIANIDQDPDLEILHGEFGGWVLGINAENGTQAWNIPVDLNSWIQTAPAILDVNQDNQLDFVVATWSFDTAHTIYAFDGSNQQLLWKSSAPNDYIYHGGAFADIDGDQKPEIAFADYSGQVMVLNAEDGSVLWTYSRPFPVYAGAPISIGDINGDGNLNLVYLDAYTLVALNHTGQEIWNYTLPNSGQAFRGAALADLDNDSIPDVTIGTSAGQVISLNGVNGSLITTIDLQAHFGAANSFEIDHGPLIADFNQDGLLDVFVVGGHAEYPNIQNNYGRAYMATLGAGFGPEWLMFRHDERRSACLCSPAPNHLSLEAEKTFEFSLYPNPTTDFLNLSVPEEWIGKEGFVYDLEGKLIQNFRIKGKTQSLNLKTYPSGVYLISLPNNIQSQFIRL